MMQNHTGHVSMDPVFQALRINMQDKICKWFERKHTNQSSEWKQRLPDIAKMLEESIFKESLNKDDYMSKFQSGIESRIINMQNQLNQQWQQRLQQQQQSQQQQQLQSQQQQLSQQQNQHQTMAHHNIQSNSSVSGMMIPTPGISHNPTGTMRMPSSMDPEFQALRINMQDKICKWFERKYTNQSSEWKQRLPDIAKMLEESIFKESLNKDDYMSKFQSGIESRIINMQNQLNQKRQQRLQQQQQSQQQQQQQQLSQQQNQHQTMAHHNIQSNSSVSGMMIPTPGISHNPTGTMRMPSSMESNQGINPTSGPAGTMSNGFHLSHGSMSINQPGSTSMSASIGVQCQVTPQMIRTPGFNSTSTTQVTQQTMPMNSDYNNGSGMQPEKQQQYNTLSGQVRPGM